ncbi:MAG: cell division protein ZapA [Gammaproteobacteria bacterium]|nr:cell division protein ZapA [Gammaproteobacteria bacterium]
MGNSNTTVTVNILEKDYEVACAPGEVDALKASARYVDRQMQSIRNSGKVIGLDRVAVMAALNIANEYLGTESRRKQTEERIDLLAEKLKQVIEQQDSPEAV